MPELTRSYLSTDTGAPTLSGTAGDLTTLLDAVLVNGYNSRTVTITRSGTTATINFTGHGWRDGQILVVSGANESDYNITARCTYIDANNVSIQVANSPATPATGTITCKVAPVGWTIAYTATNKRAYRMPAGTNQFYLRVDDTGTGSAAYARSIMYESMSDIDTGSGPMPTAAIASGGAYFHKSSSASATTRPYKIFATPKFVNYFYAADGTYFVRFGFGDFVSYKGGDVYNSYLRLGLNSSDWRSPDGSIVGSVNAYSGTINDCISRSYLNTGASIRAYPVNPYKSSGYIGGGSGTWGYPAPMQGGIAMVPLLFNEEGASFIGPRGKLPGLWDVMHSIYGDGATWPDGTTWSGATGSALAGKKFLVIREGYSGSAFVIETSDTWDEE